MSPKEVVSKAAHYANRLAGFIYRWPWNGTLFAVAVFLALENVLFYQTCLVLFKLESYDKFTASMAPVFQFVNWMIGTAVAAHVGKRLSTKADVITAEADAEVRKSQTGEFAARAVT